MLIYTVMSLPETMRTLHCLSVEITRISTSRLLRLLLWWLIRLICLVTTLRRLRRLLLRRRRSAVFGHLWLLC
jgi:hypothetical protein